MKNQNRNLKKQLSFFLTGIIFIIITFSADGQTSVKEILRTHTMPDAEIKDIINYKTATAKISDFKGKLLILDFWATYCAPCVAMFPKTDSLEKIFDGKVQFLPITKESREKATDFLNRMFNIRHIKPISVVNDILFSRYFPHSTVPYYIWINSEGKVIARTGYEEITRQNIDLALSGKPIPFGNRTEGLRWKKLNIQNSAFVVSNNFQLADTLTKRDEIPGSDINSYSIATKYVDGGAGTLYFDMNHFACVNMSIEFLYRLYYDLSYYDTPARGAFDSEINHVFEFKDSTLKDRIVDTCDEAKENTNQVLDWMKNNCVCYEIKYPKDITWKEKMNLVRQDLDRYFATPLGFKAKVEQRIDTITVLSLIREKTIPLTAGGAPQEHHDRYFYSQSNLSLGHFIGLLNSYFFQGAKTHFIDQSGLTTPVDIELQCDMTKIESINIALNKYGLQLTKQSKKIDVLVFSDTRP